MLLAIKYLRFNKIINTILMLGISLGMIALENALKNYFSISSLLGIIIMALIINNFKKEEAKEIQTSYNALWQGFEILLFVLVGVVTNAQYAFSKDGTLIAGLIFIVLIFRSICVICCVIGTKFNIKEKIFIIISYLPKATVQASIGAIALNEGLACGEIILTAAVVSILITAPFGAILMDNLYKKLLLKDNIENIDENHIIKLEK